MHGIPSIGTQRCSVHFDFVPLMIVKRITGFLFFLLALVAVAPSSAEDSFFDRELDREITSLTGALGRPEAFLHVYAIWDLVDFARWDERIPNALSQVLESPTASPVLKSHSLWLLREVDLRRGDLEGAYRKQAELGFIAQWFIIGPFDNEGMAGFDLSYPPEEEIDLSGTYTGKERPVSWREYPLPSSDCYVDLSATFRPNTQTAAYALACVFSPQQQAVAVRLGSDDCAKVWIGNRLVISDRDLHPIGFDQAVLPATLKEGWNKLLLKICQEDGEWGFWLRLTEPDGRPLSSLRIAIGSDEVAQAIQQIHQETDEKSSASESVEEHAPAADPIAQFRGMVEGDPKNPVHHASLSFLLSHLNAFDKNTRAHVKELETAAALSPREWQYHFRLGELYDDENKKRDAYQKTTELNPDFAPAYVRLGEHYAGKNLPRKALGFFLEAIEKDPSYYPAALGIAQHYAENAQKPRSAKLWAELLHEYHDVPDVLSRAAKSSPSPRPLQAVQESCQRALELNYADREVREALLSNCHKRLDFEGALDQLGIMKRQDPMSTSLLLDHARLCGDRAQYDEATALIVRALEICPEEDAALQLRGELLLQQGKAGEALEWFEKSYAVKPQNHPLRERIEVLKPKEKPFEEDYRVDASALVKNAAPEIGSPGDSAAYLHDLWIREVHPNGLTNSYHQEIVRILSEAGVENFRLRRAIYPPTTNQIQVKAARVFKKDGRVVNADGPFTHTFGGEQKIYYDLEAKYVRFSSLEPGDTIEFAYRVNATAPTNMYGDYFGDIVYLKETVPKKVMQYVVLAPPEKKLYYNVVSLDVQPEISKQDKLTAYLWKIENIEKLEAEPSMPGFSEVLPYVHISTYPDWESVGEWYWNLVREQFLLDAGARAEVARITAGLENERDKIVAIHNYVVQNTRYIGLEFGIHGHKPYPAYKVFGRKFGDCKDKAGLMLAMLKEVGVEACLAAIRTKSQGRFEPQPASLAAFNHAICYIPKYDLWLDGTAEYSGTDEFPYEDQDTCALVVGKGVRKFVTTPSLPAERNLISDRYEAVILPTGGIEFETAREAIGQYAPYFRQMYQEEKDRRNALSKSWGATLPNINISEFRFDNLKALEKPVRYALKATAPDYAVVGGDGSMAFPGLIQKLYLTRQYAALSKRNFDLVFDFPWTMASSIRFRLPAGCKVVSVPQDIHLHADFGRCDVTFASPEAGLLEVVSRFSFDVTRVKPEQYDAFREFCRLVDEKWSERIRIAR